MNLRWIRFALALCSAVGVLSANSAAAQQAPSFVNFETITTRGLAISPNGQLLFVTNTPLGRLEIFNITPAGIQLRSTVQVGLDPTAVAARSDTEVWVVNHLSDDVSIVDLSGPAPRVVRTLLVGDEPRDVVFAGPDRSRAFISAARRGQNHPADIIREANTPSIGRGDVWVFDANNTGNQLGGKPMAILQLFSDKLGDLAVSPDGKSVFVDVVTSGNQSVVISGLSVCPTAQPCQRGLGQAPGGPIAPRTAQDGTRSSNNTVLVQFDNQKKQWLDIMGRDWSTFVRFDLPDFDMFQIDAMATPPKQVKNFAHIGTLNAGIAVNPKTGKVYVATIEAINRNRFLSAPQLDPKFVPNPNPQRGQARTADPVTGKTLNGHLYESRITVVDPSTSAVQPRHLNKHIDYEVVPSPAGVKERSVGEPKGLAISEDGSTIFVAAMGSNQIVPFKTSEIDSDSFTPTASGRIKLSGLGVTNFELEKGGKRGFAYNRLSNSVAVVDLTTNKEVMDVPLDDPTPAGAKAGRRFFYDATVAGSNGEANCSVCHPQADKDDLAWDIGNPFLPAKADNNTAAAAFNRGSNFAQLKGNLAVITLRGIKDHGPLFWRGDMNAGGQNDGRANFKGFNIVFPALLGRETMLNDQELERFTDFATTIMPPPNPNRALDQTLTPRQLQAQNVFMTFNADGPLNCNTCHRIDPARNLFGTNKGSTGDGSPVNFKVCKLRDLYDKIGMFGRTDSIAGSNRTGPQVRGVGLSVSGTDGSFPEFGIGFSTNAEQERMLTEFLVAFPSNLAPIVGQQVTLRADSGADTRARINLMIQRAKTPFVSAEFPNSTECDLIAKGVIGGAPRGFLMLRDGRFQDDGNGAPISDQQLIDMARMPGQELTFTCVPPGSGRRLGIDIDQNGRPDFMERPARSAALPEPAVADADGSLLGSARGLIARLFDN